MTCRSGARWETWREGAGRRELDSVDGRCSWALGRVRHPRRKTGKACLDPGWRLLGCGKGERTSAPGVSDDMAPPSLLRNIGISFDRQFLATSSEVRSTTEAELTRKRWLHRCSEERGLLLAGMPPAPGPASANNHLRRKRSANGRVQHVVPCDMPWHRTTVNSGNFGACMPRGAVPNSVKFGKGHGLTPLLHPPVLPTLLASFANSAKFAQVSPTLFVPASFGIDYTPPLITRPLARSQTFNGRVD